MTDETLDLARRKAADTGVETVEFLKRYLEKLPVSDKKTPGLSGSPRPGRQSLARPAMSDPPVSAPTSKSRSVERAAILFRCGRRGSL